MLSIEDKPPCHNIGYPPTRAFERSSPGSMVQWYRGRDEYTTGENKTGCEGEELPPEARNL